MKKLSFAILALVTLSLGSCKKNYQCACTKTRTSGGTTLITDDGSYTFNDTRARAVTRCNDEEGTGTDVGGAYTRSCEIK